MISAGIFVLAFAISVVIQAFTYTRIHLETRRQKHFTMREAKLDSVSVSNKAQCLLTQIQLKIHLEAKVSYSKKASPIVDCSFFGWSLD